METGMSGFALNTTFDSSFISDGTISPVVCVASNELALKMNSLWLIDKSFTNAGEKLRFASTVNGSAVTGTEWSFIQNLK